MSPTCGLFKSFGRICAVALPCMMLLHTAKPSAGAQKWEPMASGTTADLRSVWGNSSSDVYAVGGNGTILHYDGLSWSPMNSNTSAFLWDLWGMSNRDMYAVGGDSAGRNWILHYDGDAWQQMVCPQVEDPLYSVWGSSGSDIFTVSQAGYIGHFDGAAWSSMATPRGVQNTTLWGTSSSDVFCGSGVNGGYIWHWDGSSWSEMDLPGACHAWGLWADTSSDWFALGSNICHYDGTTWSVMSDFLGEWLYSVHGTSGSDVFAVGGSGTIVHYDGVSWSPMKSKTDATLWGVWAFQTDVFAVGAGGTILRYHRGEPAADPVDFEITQARMVSANELGIDIKVRFPRGFPEESPRKVDFWANVNGTDVRGTCDITSLVGPGDTANIRFDDPWGSAGPHRVINFKSKGVPRFEDHVAFTLYGVAYWEGGQYSEVVSIPVEISLPVIIIHGYVYTHTAGGWFLDKVKFMAYNDLMGFLADNGYTTDESWYRTMWGPTDCQYQADKMTELDIYSDVDFWVERALETEGGTSRTYADKVNIIGHSTGGLVARYYSGDASTVNKVISIGTPHLGLTLFYQYAFDKSSKEHADKILRVNPRDPTSEENLLRWFEPEYGESCLVDATTRDAVPEPYQNNFNPAYNPNVAYLSIYANHHTDTPYKLVVNRKNNGWYEILDVLDGNGDRTVLELSGSSFSPDPTPITSGVHQFLCEEPEVQARVIDFLSGK